MLFRDQYTNCATRLNIPDSTTTSNLPEHGQNPFQPCPSTRRNKLSKNGKNDNSAARLYLWLANCYFAHDSSRFRALLPFFDA